MKVFYVSVTLQYKWQKATGDSSAFGVLIVAADAAAAELAAKAKYESAGYCEVVTAVASLASLKDFYNHLSKLDWYYAYSDDHSVFKGGERALYEATAMAGFGGAEFMDLYEQFRNHYFKDGAKPVLKEDA